MIVMFGLIMSVLMAVSASAALLDLDDTKTTVKVDGELLEEGATNAITQLERGEEFDLNVKLQASNPVGAEGDVVEDVEINVFITGFEHSSSEKISDSVRPFNLGANENVVKTLTLKLPDRADEGKYQVRVIISDKNNEPIVKNYNIKVEPADTNVVIKSFELSPESEVQAGRPVISNVRVKNLGDSDEDDVQVKVSIPELGVSSFGGSIFIDELEEDKSTTAGEFFLHINKCTRPGIYEAVAQVTFDDGDETVTATKEITVTKGNCDVVTAESGQVVTGQITITPSPETQTIVAGSSAVSYPITITNSGTSTKAFTLSVDSADWANFRVSPSNLVTVKAGQTQTVFVFASANAGTSAGDRVFTVSVKNSAGDVLKNLALKADVASSGRAGVGDLSSLRNALTAGLIFVVAILVVIGLLLAFRRVKGGDEGESQTYY